MSSAFIETIRIENFGCVHDARFELTRLHALIGPNDSGKSTVLSAIQTAGELIRIGAHSLARAGRLDPRGTTGSKVTMSSALTKVTCLRTAVTWKVLCDMSEGQRRNELLTQPFSDHIANFARGATLVRWDPDAIRRPCKPIPDSGSLTLGGKGEGVPAIYEALWSRDRPAFDAIEAGVKRHFPTVNTLWLPTSSHSRKTLGVLLNDGTEVHADAMSEGLLCWLAFAVLPHVDSTAILLIENPETSLHPARICEVMKVLRTVSSRIQVILTTHSPLVINELQPQEVTLLARDERTGTRATRLDQTTHFQQRHRVYSLGELWLSFTDGASETALVPQGHTSKKNRQADQRCSRVSAG